MVSLRRRRLLGLCSGVQNSFLAPLPRLFECGNSPENGNHNSNPVSVHPLPMDDDTKPPLEVNDPMEGIDQSNASGSTELNQNISVSASSKEQNVQLNNEQVKRRKQSRKRRVSNQDQCVLRGVYFKNMKWQAAIKVDKKQIHLGTVSSQEEAARLYDRAAFMCGREPNFELPEEEKQQLRNFKWDEFLSMTRRAISSKRTRRRQGIGAGAEGFSTSDDAAETTVSEYVDLGLNSYPS